MDGMKQFLNKLNEQTAETGKEDVSKNLAKEDALSLIADFVKNVKKQFAKPADRIKILKTANETLGFYIDEIESEGINFEIPDTDFEEEGDDEEFSFDNDDEENEEESSDEEESGNEKGEI